MIAFLRFIELDYPASCPDSNQRNLPIIWSNNDITGTLIDTDFSEILNGHRYYCPVSLT